jgi:LPPG:FO 2-phospho-L-lactate transferase
MKRAAVKRERGKAALPPAGRVLAVCGGVGGAKLALGLDAVLEPGRLTVVVNTGDDFEHLGLHVSPDLDTVLYALAGLSDPVRGWGRADETWNFMESLRALGGETWFALGDRDLALHVERTRRLRAGETLTSIAADMARRVGVKARIVPMTDDAVRTVVHTPGGPLHFQHYFVRQACAPVVTAISFEGASKARPNPLFMDALADPALAAIVLCPSNPYLSVDPILALPGVREALRRSAAPVVAVSPIIGGEAVKGPTAKIMRELGIAVASRAVADHYRGLIDGLVIDEADAADADELEVAVAVRPTLMVSAEDKRNLARGVLAFAARLASEREAA